MSAHLTRDGSPSVAGMQIAHDTRGIDTAPVTLADAIAWGENNRMRPTGNDAKDLAAINRMRAILKLPAFSLIPRRNLTDEPMPPPHEYEPGDAAPRAPFSMASIKPAVRQPVTPKELPPMAAVPMQVARTEEPNHVAATSKRLREILFQELTDLREGKSNPQQASAVAKIAHQIIAGVRMEMDFAREFPPTIEGSATKLLAG